MVLVSSFFIVPMLMLAASLLIRVFEHNHRI